jgi:hypothetical protein
MCSAPDVAPPLPHALGVGLQKSVKIFETLHSLFSDMSWFIRTEMNGNWASSFGFEMLCVSVGQINREAY